MSNTEVGDHVEQDEEIATIETDKVTMFSYLPLVLPLIDFIAK